MKKYLVVLSLLAFFACNLSAQYITNGQDTLFGNEWINFDQTYFKIKVAKDGIYRIPSQALADGGVPIGQVAGQQFQLWHNGEQVPIYTSTDSNFGTSDYFEFFGKKNTSELDRFLFEDPDSMMMNPLYSLFTDTAVYFLTWKANSAGLRYETVPNDLVNLPNKEDYYLADLTIIRSDIAYKETQSDNVIFSDFTMAEGFSTGYSNTFNFQLTPTNIYQGAIGGNLSLRFAGRNGQHQQLISLNNQTILTADFSGYQVQLPTIPLDNSQLVASMNLKLQGSISSNDVSRVSNINLKYPRLFDFEGKSAYEFQIEASNSIKYLEINNFNISGGQPVLYDLTNGKRMVAVTEGGMVKFALPPANGARNLMLINNNTGTVTMPQISPFQFVDFRALNYNYIILSSNRLFDDGNGNNRVQEYADYRASQAGGSYNPILVEVEQLYDQFSWGIERHPFAVRNFGLFLKEHWSDPKYIFIIGKGLEYKEVRTTQGLNTQGSFFYVPTYGIPGADNLLMSAGLSKAPVIPTCRISARSPDEIKTYLEKVKEFDETANLQQTIADRAWMKRVLHLGGGATVGEQQAIRANLKDLEVEISNNLFGAEVTSFFKSSTDPIQQSQSEQLLEMIRTGVSIITFFGHSSVNTFDFSIDRPEKFNNKGKYPFIFPLGCNTGNIHVVGFGADQRGISEEFIFAPESGGIAFGATSSYGYVSALHQFMDEFYRLAGSDLYGAGIGDILQQTIASYGGASNTSLSLLLQQFTLNGDPALKLMPNPGPDFTLDANTVAFSPNTINAQQDSFTVSFDIVNLGQFKHDTVLLEVRRVLPNGTEILLVNERVEAPPFRKEVKIKAAVGGEASTGINRIYAKVDAENAVDELPLPFAELNNELLNSLGQAGIEFFIRSNAVVPLVPADFGIINQLSPTLIASTTDAFAALQKYVFELDTTELFNSPLKLQQSMEKGGGILKWKPSFNLKNGNVYYWRVSPDSTGNGNYLWRNSSFIYLANSAEGWNQSHRYQYLKDEFENMELAPNGDHIKYIDDVKDLKIENGVFPLHYPLFLINNTRVQGWVNATVDAGIYVIEFDSVSVLPIENPPGGLYGSYNANSTRYLKAFPYKTNSLEERQKLIDFLQNNVTDNNYVLVFTIQQSTIDYEPSEWEADSLITGTNLFAVIESQGATKIRSTAINGASPYAFFYRKNRPDFTGGGEFLVGLTERIDATFPVEGQWNEGAIETGLIGPAQKWERLQWEIEGFEPDNDTISLSLIGVSKMLSDSVLVEDLSAFDTDLSNVDATVFPFLKLRLNSKDTLYRTSPQLKYWRVLYEGLPEAAINPAAKFTFHADTLEAGETLGLTLQVNSLLPRNMDSLLVKYVITEEKTNQVRQFQQRISPLLANDSLVLEFHADTRGFKGQQQILVEINPDDDQREQQHFNNFGLKDFYVKGDERNPMLDITFDGTHILDGDIVSPAPQISISLKDENRFLALNDTALFQVFIKYPEEDESRGVAIGSESMQFFPANLNATGMNNRASLVFTPDFVEDGIYQLLVQAKDISGNQAGKIDFKVNFEVVNKSSISNLVNYPNPFSNATRFLYTMTGLELPTNFKIQIMTVSGRVVREITQDEIGVLKTGTHLTDFQWDGTDEFGDKLANGVYLYRFMAKDINGKDWDLRASQVDKFTQKGFGKMVIIR